MMKTTTRGASQHYYMNIDLPSYVALRKIVLVEF